MRCGRDEFRALLAATTVASELVEFLEAPPGQGQLPEGDWSEPLRALAQATVFGFAEVDGPQPVRGVVAVGDGAGVRVRLLGDEVHTDVMRADAPWPALVGCLPECEPAAGCEVTVPTIEFTEARAAAATRSPQSDGLEVELRRRLVPPDDARAVAELMARADEITATLSVAWRPNGTLHRWPHRITVHHAPAGRVAVIPESPDDTFTIVAPADAYLLSKTLQEYLEHLTAISG